MITHKCWKYWINQPFYTLKIICYLYLNKIVKATEAFDEYENHSKYVNSVNNVISVAELLIDLYDIQNNIELKTDI